MSSGAKGRPANSHGQGKPRRERPEKPVAHIDQSLCDRSPGCPVRRVCPKNAVVPDGAATAERRGGFLGIFSGGTHSGWKVDESKCSGCLLCAQYCPHQAVQARLRAAS
jgi:MinD superfamily P-loop ATPase